MTTTATTQTTFAPHTLVDDGQVRWYADTAELVRALTEYGYTVVRGTTIESDRDFGDDGSHEVDAYSAVCGAVGPIDEELIADGTPIETMTYEPSVSQRGFVCSRALAAAL